jgi:hypothetical protein
MPSEIQIFVGDVNNVEGRVYARYTGPAAGGQEHAGHQPIRLRGTLRGPYCERAHTLPAEFTFRDLGPKKTGLAEVIVPDPCTWSHDLPHLYQADVEVYRGETVLAEYHGRIGLREATGEND